VSGKRWKVARTGIEPLRDLYAAKEAREAHECLYIATGEITDNARQFAQDKQIRLVDGPELARLLPGMGRGRKAISRSATCPDARHSQPWPRWTTEGRPDGHRDGRRKVPRRGSPHGLRIFPVTTRRTAVSRIWRMVIGVILFVALLLAGPLLTLAFGRASISGDWRTASHRATGLAPDPASHRDAVVQVYASRAFGWRGAFADHTWLAAKPEGADRYTRFEVIGWYGGGGRSVVSLSDQRAPDAEWYGATPRLIRDLRGREAEAVIVKLPQAVAAYPYANTYSAWPGPNSNTFVAHLGREIPELRLTLPSTAIGKDYLSDGRIFARTPSGHGYQLSLGGVFGVMAGWDEGLEVNVLGLVTGIDVRNPALKLPGFGRVPGDG